MDQAQHNWVFFIFIFIKDISYVFEKNVLKIQISLVPSTLEPVTIVIKPGLGVDPAKGPGLGFHGSTRVNPD